jgi:hypothetical protein
VLAGPGFWDLEIERAGWARVLWPADSAFPELRGRGQVWGRNLYTRGADRLVMEWSSPVTLSAVLLNGRVRPVRTAEELSAAIRRPDE